MSPLVTWSILGVDGSIEQGRGQVPPPGWFNRVRACLGLALLVPGYPPLYAVRPTCSTDVDRGLFSDGSQAELARFWGVAPEPGSQVWFYPDASLIGIGRDTTEVSRLVACLGGKLKASEVASGPDQRGQS